jgi:Lrp/AsnC family transcriptional regulator, leucine-responsive regulatory protein
MTSSLLMVNFMLDSQPAWRNTPRKVLSLIYHLRGRTFGTMALRSERTLDDTDWRILGELQADGRLSFNELGRRVNLSPPAVAERVRRLEEAGVIAGYQARVDPARAGLPLTAFVQMRCRLDHCLLKTSKASDYPEVVEIHKLSGDHCSMLKVRAASMEHFEGLLERLGRHGEMRTSVVLSTQYDGRPVEAPAEDYLRATHSQGWR